ncbi:MAG: histidinol-phosphate transaminase [Desulfitobacterium hafniense]|nr:histidinol-phosphate transaminase [Desulfitobacterium hafniense]
MIRALRPYESKVVPDCLKLDANENPFPWPEGMKEDLLSQKVALTRYPDGSAIELRKAISEYTGVPAEGILVGNGSDELIQLLLAVFGGEEKALLVHPPTFSMYYAAAKVTGTGIKEVPLIGGISLDTEKMVEVGSLPEVNVIIVCSPNNPTGTLYPRQEILKIVQETGKIVIVDEAYSEFAGESLINEISNYPNLIVMRTFSKAFGLAGLRLGYLLGQPSTIELINRARQPFNVNAFSQKAGVVALKYLREYQEQIEVLKVEIADLAAELGRIPGIQVFQTRANFVLFKPDNPDEWAKAFAEKGFMVRNMGELPVIGKALRVSSGTPQENELFKKAIREIAVERGSI